MVPIRGDHTAQRVGDALITVLARLPASLRRTLTWDQGNEMFHHERIETAADIRIYFADPRSPWQRGSNENKGTDLGQATDQQIRHVADELNDRPRACLNDRSPAQLVRRWRHQLMTT
ncbi:IS30 family transposase [Spirillospora sp. NPDC048911]|uniref:IS30 family transposase n=1 Tax=Spirillospora sp. NPDC048911 TaxID=3364527 RepID=UPI0037128D5B